MPEFFSALVLSQRVRELESATRRDTGELTDLAALAARVEKRLQWLQKRLRGQRLKTAATERGLGLARCYVNAAQVREYVARWGSEHTSGGAMAPSVAELEANVASLVGSLLVTVEQALKARDDALGMHTAPASANSEEPANDVESFDPAEDLDYGEGPDEGEGSDDTGPAPGL